MNKSSLLNFFSTDVVSGSNSPEPDVGSGEFETSPKDMNQFVVSQSQLLNTDVNSMKQTLANNMKEIDVDNLKASETMTTLLNKSFTLIDPNETEKLYTDDVVAQLNLDLKFIDLFLQFYQYQQNDNNGNPNISEGDVDKTEQIKIKKLIEWLHTRFMNGSVPTLVDVKLKLTDDIFKESFSYDCIEFQKMLLNTIILSSCNVYDGIIKTLDNLSPTIKNIDGLLKPFESIKQNCEMLKKMNLFDPTHMPDGEQKQVMLEIVALIEATAKKHCESITTILESKNAENNMTALYYFVIEGINNSNILNKFMKQMSPNTERRVQYQINTDNTQSQTNEYTFNNKHYREMYKKYLTGTREQVYMKQSLETFYYHVLIEKEAEQKLPYIKQSLNVIKTKFQTPEMRETIINKYLECFRSFVFNNDYRHLGLGAHLISMLIIPYVRPYYLLDKLDEEYFLKSENVEKKIEYVLQNIETVVATKEKVDIFHQDPYLLGFFTFLNLKHDEIAGTCQDNTLIQIMKADSEDRLYGIELFNYPKVTHWNIIDPSKETFSDHAIAITHDRVLFSKSIGTNVINRKDHDKKIDSEEGVQDSVFLRKNDVQKIEKTNHQARANIFLAMTLAHVYRHTKIANESNEPNGIAFEYNSTQSDVLSFEEAIMNYIHNTIFINVGQSTKDDLDLITRFSSMLKPLDFRSIKKLFGREFDTIVKKSQPNTRPVSRGGAKKPRCSRTSRYEKYGKFKNRVVYKKNNTLYIKVKKKNNFIYKKVEIPEGIA